MLRLAQKTIQPPVLETMLPERETNFHLLSRIRMYGVEFLFPMPLYVVYFSMGRRSYFYYMEVSGFFNLPNPSSNIVALGPTQPLTEMSTRNLPGSKGPLARKTDSLTSTCEPIV
jgi:hypothetical protein